MDSEPTWFGHETFLRQDLLQLVQWLGWRKKPGITTGASEEDEENILINVVIISVVANAGGATHDRWVVVGICLE